MPTASKWQRLYKTSSDDWKDWYDESHRWSATLDNCDVIVSKPASLQSPSVKWLVLGQLGAVLVVSLMFWLKDDVAAYSAFFGGMVFFVPNLYFIHKAFAHSGARAARQIVNSLYKGEAIKLLLTAVLFSTVFVMVKPLDILALFSAFFVLLMTNWLTPLLLGKRSLRN